MVGEEVHGEGVTSYLVSVRTEFLRDLELDEHALARLNLLMSYAAMSGPVYDATRGTLELCSLVRVHDAISQWINPLISVAAVLQVGEARIMAAEVAELLHATDATSGHPERGERAIPDELAEIIATFIGPEGRQRCRWLATEFQDAVDQHMQQPPSLGATSVGPGFTVELPFGAEESSLCQFGADQPHPRYGNGLFQLQSFPVGVSAADGVRLALSLNAIELAEKPSGYGLGSFVFRDGAVHFASFLPNAAYRPNLLPNLYFASCARARAMSLRLTNTDWSAESFDWRRSAAARLSRKKHST